MNETEARNQANELVDALAQGTLTPEEAKTMGALFITDAYVLGQSRGQRRACDRIFKEVAAWLETNATTMAAAGRGDAASAFREAARTLIENWLSALDRLVDNED